MLYTCYKKYRVLIQKVIMKSGKEILEEKINELEKIKKRCSEENYLPSGMLANYAMRDFLEWHIRDLKHILKVLERTN